MNPTRVLKLTTAKQKSLFCLSPKQNVLFGLLFGQYHGEGKRVLVCHPESKRAFCFAYWKSKSKRFCFLGSFALRFVPVDNLWKSRKCVTTLRSSKDMRGGSVDSEKMSAIRCLVSDR